MKFKPNNMKNTNVCLKGDGTDEAGWKIINYFLNCGAREDTGYMGNTTYYYFIRDNRITTSNCVPYGYTLIDLPKDKPEESPLPKWMWVWDHDENDAVKRYIIFKDKNDMFVAIADSDSEDSNTHNNYISGTNTLYSYMPFKYAKDIEKETHENPLLKELETLKQRIAEIENQIKTKQHETDL